jgi:hypothetical protein
MDLQGCANVRQLLERHAQGACKITRNNASQNILQIVYDRALVEQFFKRSRLKLHNDNQHVTTHRVLQHLCSSMGVSKFDEFGLGPAQHCPFVKVLSHRENEIETVITSFFVRCVPAAESLSTWYDAPRSVRTCRMFQGNNIWRMLLQFLLVLSMGSCLEGQCTPQCRQ